ncbi:ATP-binding cassette sub-family A member 3, partial [Orchesella cincta]
IDIPNLGIEIFPVRESVNTSNGTSSSTVKVGVTGYFNNQGLHVSAVAVALIDNILMDYIEDKIRRDAIIHKQPPYIPKGYYFNVSNHPLNYQPADVIKYSELFIGPGYIFGICTAFSYSFLIASFIIMHIDEQEFRHLQMVAGANKIIFWASNYLWNIVLFSIVAGLHVCLIALVGLNGVAGFTDESWDHNIQHLGSTFIFILMYGISSVCIVGSFATHSYISWGRGFSKIALIFLITGPLIMLILIPLQNVLIVDRRLFTAIHNILLFLPSYGFGTGLYYIVTDQVYHVECDRYRATRNVACDNSLHVNPFNEFSHDGSTEQACCFNNQNNAFSFVAYGVGRNLLTMALVTAVCIAQKVYSHSKRKRVMEKKALEKKARKWRPLTINEHEVRDYDVLSETAKIYRGDDSHDFTIRNLTVESPLYVRVDNMCIEIPKGECFALLGSIGSGKSIFLKTLCGYPGFFSTYGDVELHGLFLNSDYDKYISHVSYCPDHNPFLCEMSGQEVLELIGTCRKIPTDVLDKFIDHYTSNLGFKNEIELPIRGYSSVHAKKLSVATALLGKFEVLMLDEPLHHLDPKSRQFIISSVKRLMQDGCMVIWTAQSIEQCESICTKMSIFVNGTLRCIGSLPHLRDLYEQGYTVIVRFELDKDMIYFTSKKNIRMEHELREDDIEDEVGATVGLTKQEARKKTLTDALGDMELALSELAPWEQDLCPFVAYFERAFPDAILVDKQPGFIHYHVNQSQATWSMLFRKMEEAKTVAEVDSYYVACTNLDQVFFNFTRGQISLDS